MLRCVVQRGTTIVALYGQCLHVIWNYVDVIGSEMNHLLWPYIDDVHAEF